MPKKLSSILINSFQLMNNLSEEKTFNILSCLLLLYFEHSSQISRADDVLSTCGAKKVSRQFDMGSQELNLR